MRVVDLRIGSGPKPLTFDGAGDYVPLHADHTWGVFVVVYPHATDPVRSSVSFVVAHDELEAMDQFRDGHPQIAASDIKQIDRLPLDALGFVLLEVPKVIPSDG